MTLTLQQTRACGRCGPGTTITIGPFTQPPLLRGAGYGAATKTTIRVCDTCGRATIATTTTARPPR